MFQIDCDHDAAECQCYARPGAAAQSLDELEFVRSACHAAQLGQLDKLERILRNRPEAINWDGGTGGVHMWQCNCSSKALTAASLSPVCCKQHSNVRWYFGGILLPLQTFDADSACDLVPNLLLLHTGMHTFCVQQCQAPVATRRCTMQRGQGSSKQCSCC
jgi:hypothetical protein